MLYVLLLLLVIYSALLIYYWWAWQSLPVWKTGKLVDSPRVSIIIPARNEEANIHSLLTSIAKQDYPADKTEIIVVDDHSTDQTASLARSFPGAKVISLTDDQLNSYKKKALEKGISEATGEWIITTDADCIVPSGWISHLMGFATANNAVFIAAPVVIDAGTTVVGQFQSMDFMMLQGITGAASVGSGMSMCNGANLAYTKEAFTNVNGFSGIDDIASGDDMLLMYKMQLMFPGRVKYIKAKGVIVQTAPVNSWTGFFQQRIRWASKARRYNDKRIFPVLLLVYLFNLSFLALAIAGCWDSVYWCWLLYGLLAKTVVELPLYISTAIFFNKTASIILFPFFQPLHIIYTLWSGLLGQVSSYEWKGRRVK